MKKLLLIALLLMPTATFARATQFVDLPREAEIRTIVEPAPTPKVVSGGGGFTDLSPRVTSPMIHQSWLPNTTYQFLTGQFGFAYFERLDGTRIYEMDYCTYHTIDTDGKGTIYFVQVDKNGYEHQALKVLEV